MSAYPQIRLPAGASTAGRAHARGALAARHFVTLALALLAAALLLLSRPAAGAEVVLSVNTAPPPLPLYEQPALPAPGYIWVPGYWSYGPEGYFWVPGTWVLPPDPDLLWTPGYWEFSDGLYVWNPGYWGPAVGFYGGIVYGFGYFGHGYEGGYWRDHQFYYNRAVNNVSNTNVTNVYNTRVTNNVTVDNVSYNGGPGGVSARPTSQEQTAAHQPRHAATAEQNAHAAGARGQHDLLAAVNQGHPPVAATPKPNSFSGPGVTAARNAGPGAEPPRRLAQAPPQTPPPTHDHPGPAERATPPPESRASPELGPNARPQAGPPAGPGASAPVRAQPQQQRQAPAHQEPARQAQPHPQRSDDHPQQ